MANKIGFMQGRLSPIVDGRIQSFPWGNWKNEFQDATQNDFHMMEWTLDQERLYENPLLTSDGQKEIIELCEQLDFSIPSLTGDCFMQSPFWKVEQEHADELKKDFISIIEACASVGIKMIVVPLVDNGRLDNRLQEDILVEFLENQSPLLAKKGVRIIFESDFSPEKLARFISRLPEKLFGINYDIGNSAALGYIPEEEFSSYGHRIVNVHIKDRMLGGTTVPLGAGSADFEMVFTELSRISYSGNYILQTARAVDDNHARPLCIYRDMVMQWIEKYNLN